MSWVDCKGFPWSVVALLSSVWGKGAVVLTGAIPSWATDVSLLKVGRLMLQSKWSESGGVSMLLLLLVSSGISSLNLRVLQMMLRGSLKLRMA